MVFLANLFLILIYIVVLITRGWLFYNNNTKVIPLFSYLLGCLNLEIGMIKTLFVYKIYRGKALLNILTLFIFFLTILLITISF
jgi:hypothetical protein